MDLFPEFVLLEFLSELFIKSTLILALAFILFTLCRKQPASLRHFILSVSLIGLLILPLFSTLQTGWETGLLPFGSRMTEDSVKSDVSLSSHQAQMSAFMQNAREESQSKAYKTAIHPTEVRRNDTLLWSFLKNGLLVIWFSGIIIILVRQIFGFYGAYKLSSEAEDLKSSFWRHLLDRFLEAISIKKKVRLLKHEKVKIPLTWGWLKPVVIMPDASRSWTREQRESALYHELSHVKRGDFFVLVLARISLGFYWFNPLSWLVFRLMKAEQEKACDELVLKTGIKPSAYAANLLSIQRSLKSPWNPPVSAVGVLERSQLNNRLCAILKQKIKLTEVKMRTKIFFSLLVILTITFFGMARPSSPNRDLKICDGRDIYLPENSDTVLEDQEETQEKKDPQKTDTKENKKKKKDVFIWTTDKKEEGDVEVTITDKEKVKIFTIKEPVIVIHKDDSGKEIAVTSDGKAIEIKKDEEGTWFIKGEALTLHEDLKKIDLGEDSIITLKTRTKDSQKTIEIEAPAVIMKKIDESNAHAIKVIDEGGKREVMLVTPHVHVEKHPDIQVHAKEVELEKIHAKLKQIHLRLSKQVGSKAEEEKQALKEMEETLEQLEEKLSTIKDELKDITMSIHEEPHHMQLKHGQAISVKHKTDRDDEEKYSLCFSKDEGRLLSFVDEEGEATIMAQMEIEKTQKQAFADAIEDIQSKLPDGYEIESEFENNSGMAKITVKGHSPSKETMDRVIDLLIRLKEKLAPKE